MAKLRIPSLSEYLQDLSWKQQVQFDMLIKIMPLLLAYGVWYYLWVFLDWGWMDSLAPSSIIGSLTVVLYVNWKDKIQTEAQAVESLNMTIWWTPTKVYDDVNVIESKTVLKEKEETGELVITRGNGDGDPIAISLEGETPEEKEVRYGKYYYCLKFATPLWDIHDKQFSYGVFLCDAPYDKTFRAVPDQWIAYKGQIFQASASRIIAVYCNEFNEVGEEHRVFRVLGDSARALAIQEGLGLKPPSVEKSNIEEAAQLTIDHSATRYAIRTREAEGQLKGLSEEWEDSTTRGLKTMNKLWDYEDTIREGRKLSKWKAPRLKWVALGIVILFAVWWIFWR